MSNIMEGDTKMAAPMPPSAGEIYRLAQSQSENQDNAQAIATLETLLEKYPEFALAHNDLGVHYFNQGKTDVSLAHYRAAVRLEPQNSVFQKNLADFYYFINQDIQPALAIYVDLLEKNPEDQEVLLALGQICMQQEKQDDAAVFFQRVLELEPTNSDAQMGLAALAGRQDSTVQDPLADKGPLPEIAQVSPSPIVDAEIATGDRRFVVKIPENEMFRIKSIFVNNEYAILTRRRQTGGFKVFDVGANVGVFALYVHAVHPESQIYCFEPGPLAQELLETNIGSLPGMNICKFGLFNRDMAATMHIHRYNTGQNSIRFDEQHHDGTASVQLLDAGRQFDDLGLSHLDVLKIDTEGCEVEILESMGHRLEKVDYVLVEYHTEKDRRTIDELMKPFHLFGANAVVAGVGTVKYIHPDLV
jgi:FkbM family methyltransferase